MRVEHRYFDVFPRVVRANSATTITIRPLFDHRRFAPDATYQVTIYPAERIGRGTGAEHAQMSPSQNTLCVHHRFEGEQEHVLVVEAVSGETKTPLAEFRIYSLEDDLFNRRPYRGDSHLHTYYSDGKESPAYVAAASRRIGQDFIAITDHRRYAPSLEAIHAFEHVEIDLRIYPGEEVHPPNNPVHMVNFGGQFSLNECFADETAYRAQVKAIEDGLGDLPPGVNRYQFASCIWCFEKIRAGGGLGVFCHPYWFTAHRYDVPQALTTHLLNSQPFDALELIGGYHRSEVESNALQVARYHEERARGRTIPIVGASDAHGCEIGELFGWYSTIVFAPSPDLPDLVRSIKELFSVAVEALPAETARAHGPFRLVKYAHFLLREVFPQHDELCAEEGRLMLAYAAGDLSAADALSACQGQTQALYAHLWTAL